MAERQLTRAELQAWADRLALQLAEHHAALAREAAIQADLERQIEALEQGLDG